MFVGRSIYYFSYLSSKSRLGPPWICVDHDHTHYFVIITFNKVSFSQSIVKAGGR